MQSQVSPLNANTARNPEDMYSFLYSLNDKRIMYHLLELLRVLRSDDSLPGGPCQLIIPKTRRSHQEYSLELV